MQGPVEIYLHFFTFSARTMCSKPITQFTIHKVPAHVHVSLIIKFWLDAGAREKNFLRARTFYLLSSYFMRRFIQQNAHQLSFIWSSAGRKVSQGSFCVHWHTIQRRAYSSSNARKSHHTRTFARLFIYFGSSSRSAHTADAETRTRNCTTEIRLARNDFDRFTSSAQRRFCALSANIDKTFSLLLLS